MFHRLHADGAKPAGQGSISRADFDRLLRHVGIERILSPAEWLRRLQRGGLQSRDLCLTFDDGLRCQYDVALPVLQSLGLLAFWFVYSIVNEGGLVKSEIYSHFATSRFESMDAFCDAFLGRCEEAARSRLTGTAFERYAQTTRAMFPFYSDNDLRYRFMRNDVLSPAAFERVMDALMADHGVAVPDLARTLWMDNRALQELHRQGHGVGLHSYDHPYQLARLPPAEQRAQYERNARHLQSLGIQPVTSMSHPLNSYGPETLAMLTSLGLLCGFRSNMTPPVGQTVNPGPLELAREDPVNLLRTL